MHKKSLLSLFVALILCFTTVIPAAAAPVFATDVTSATEATLTDEAETESDKQENNEPIVLPDEEVAPVQQTAEEAPAATNTEETPQPSLAVGDGVIAGEGTYIMDYVKSLPSDGVWTKKLNTPRPCTVEFFVAADYWMSSWFQITITNIDTGEEVYYEYDYIYDDDVFSDTIGLDAGNYTITFSNESSGSRDFDMYALYVPFYTVDDPYYHIEFPTGNRFDNLVYTGKTLQLKAAVTPAPATYETAVWSSADPSIATVDQNGLVKGISAGVTKITVNIDGHICTTDMYVYAPEYSSLNYKAISLYPQETVSLKIKVDPAEYGLSGLTWTSSNSKVASVNSKGVVTAKAKGTATITAKVNGVTRTCKVTVKPMAINKPTATVYVKKTQKLTINGGSGKTTWKSGNKKIATVNANGVVKGIKPGIATITGTKNGKKFKCKVTVKWAPETGIATTKTYITEFDKDIDINMKGPGSITVTMTNLESSSSEYLDSYFSIWNPNHNKVISSKDIDAGQTRSITINTTLRGNYSLYINTYDKCKVVVKKVQKPSLSQSTLSVGKGYTGTLKTFGVKNGGKWSSSNKGIATVNSNGVIKGKKKGTCYIKYTLKTGKVLKCKVTVTDPVTCKVTSVYDTSIYNECWVKFTNHTNKKVTYIKLNIYQYDNRGYKVDKNSYDYDWFYVNYSLKANSSDSWEFKVNDDARTCKAKITKVYFADGTTWTP